MPPIFLRPAVVLTVVTLLWGSTFAVTKDLLEAAPPLAYLTLRFSIGGLLLVLLELLQLARPRPPARPRVPGRSLPRDALVLGLLLGGGMVFQVVGQVFTTASKSAFVTALSVPLVPLLDLLRGRRLRPAQALAMGVGVLGLCLLTYPVGPATWNPGDLLTVLCAVLLAGFILAAQPRVAAHDALRLTAAQVLVSSALFGGLWLLVSLWPRAIPALAQLEARPFALSTKLLLQGAYMAVVCTVCTSLAQTWAMARLSAFQAALIFALEPVFGTAIALATFGASEWPGGRGAIGGLLVLGAVLGHELIGLRRR